MKAVCKADGLLQERKPLFTVGLITDEVSQDIGEAAAFLKSHGLTAMEIRSVNGRGLFELTEADVDEIELACRTNGLQVAALSSPTYKCDFYDTEAVKAHQEGFRKCARIARRLGAKMIRVFDFWENGVPIEERVPRFDPLIRICEENDLICVMEYDPSVHSSTPEKTAALLQAIHHPRVRGLFDPGNGLWSVPDEKPYPQGYTYMLPFLAHIHVKDAVAADGHTDAVKVGTGSVDYRGLLIELMRTGYSGYLMLETHYRLKGELTEEQLKRPGGSAFSDGALEASEESMTALLKMIEELREKP